MQQVRQLVPVEVGTDSCAAGVLALYVLSYQCDLARIGESDFLTPAITQPLVAAYRNNGAALLPYVFHTQNSALFGDDIPHFGDVLVALRNVHPSQAQRVRILDANDWEVYRVSVAPGTSVFIPPVAQCGWHPLRLRCEHPECVQVAHGYVDHPLRRAVIVGAAASCTVCHPELELEASLLPD